MAACSCGWESAPLSGLCRETLRAWGEHVAKTHHGNGAFAVDHLPGLFRNTADGGYVVPCSCGWESSPTSWLTRHLMAAWGEHISEVVPVS